MAKSLIDQIKKNSPEPELRKKYETAVINLLTKDEWVFTSGKTPDTVDRAISERPITKYKTVLPYGKMARAVRAYRQAMPEYTHDALDELASALELADRNVHDRDSERSHFAAIMMADHYASKTMRPDIEQENLFFMAEIGGQLADAYDVLECGHNPKDMQFLRRMRW